MELKVGNFYLDKSQIKIVKNKSKHLLVVAGAGSGKTLTILGKLKYLIEEKDFNPKEIICISFTKAASNELKEKIKKNLGFDINVYTFHKLALEILKNKKSFEIADANLLDDMVHSYFEIDVLKNPDSLKVVLKYFNLKNKKMYETFYKENYKEILSLEHLLSTFIHLFKSNNHELKDFITFLNRAKMTLNFKKYKREKLILKMATSIYIEYTKYLEDNDEIDFDDMLIKAKKVVDKYGFIHKTKYIIIDEYQDTSLVRFELIKSILDKTEASLMAVGDDFQSIYRFTGCDLALFLDFKKIFKDGQILKIENTYRFSQELINVAGSFIMKNRAQVRKKLLSQKSIKKPIVIKEYTYAKSAFTKLLIEIYEKTDKEILVLGRNNKDINYFLDSSEFKIAGEKIFSYAFPDMQVRYLTAHKSKGLESDNVVLINLKDDILGFPNQMIDDKILRFVSPPSKSFPFDEERRLFYVALTRTKNKVYLLVPKKDKSIFVSELIEEYSHYIDYFQKD